MKSVENGPARWRLSSEALSARIQLMVLKRGLGVLVGFWLASANAESPYVPLIFDNPTPQNDAYFGDAVAGAGDVNRDGIPDLLVGASWQNADGNYAQGRAFVFSGADGSLLHILNNPTPQAVAYFGRAMARAGDVNRDGIPDLLVGAPFQDVGSHADQGQAYIFSGADGALVYTLDNPTPQDDAYFGDAVAGAGDVNRDGISDLLVGASSQDLGGNFGQGQAFVFSGADGTLLQTLDTPLPQEGAHFGSAVAGAGDVNGDGVPDLLVGASGQTVAGNRGQGRAFVLSGIDGTLLHTLDDPIVQESAHFGDAVAGAGDVNGDGTPDFLVGAYLQDVGGNEYQGRAFAFSGADGTLLQTLDTPLPQEGAHFGSAVAGAGDVNGDSKSDLLVGAPRQTVGGNAHQGQAFIFSGADGILLHTLDHPTPKDDAHFGQVLASAGDVNGDGKTDLLIGAWNQSVDGNPGQGQAVLFVSRPTTPVCFGMPATIVGTAGNDVLRGTPGNDVIVGLAGHDVIDGRGGDDLICGGDGNDTLRGGTGNDKLSGGEDNDILWGGAGDDLLEGGPGRDRASGGSGNDILRGGEGDDMLNVVDGAGGNDIADGGSHVNGDRCAADNRDTVQNCNL